MRFTKYLMAITLWLSLSEAFNLECSSTEVTNWLVVGETFTCVVANMKITKRGEVMTSARSVATISQVKGIDIENQTVHYVPKFTKELAQRLEVFRVFSCHLKAIEGDDLVQFPNLKALSLRDNDLESLPGNLLQSTPKLEIVSFDGNNLKSVGANILKSLSNLKEAWFGGSGCIDFNAQSPADIETLKSQLMTKCKSPEDKIAQLEKEIDELKLKTGQDQQKISNLEGKVIEEQKNTAALEQKLQQKGSECATNSDQLSQKISNLEGKVREEQKKTTRARQQIADLDSEVAHLQQKWRSCDQNLNSATQNLSPLFAQIDSTSPAESTVEIVCSRYSNQTKTCNAIDFAIADSVTKVVTVKDEFGNEVRPTILIIRHLAALFLPINLQEVLPDLQHLEVSSSGIFLVNRKTFARLYKLASLNLTSNKILTIASGLFVDLKLLTKLDLSSNRLEKIEPGAFDGLESLRELNLEDNKLKQIVASFLSPIPSLDSLNLRNNPCIDLAHPGTSLEEIEAATIKSCFVPVELNCIASNDHDVCDTENLQVEQRNAKLRIVNGKSPENVTNLVAEGQLVKFLPLQLSSTFPKLQKLVVVRSELTLLTKNDFVGLTDLQWIEICDNRITSIEAGTFDSVPQLVHLDLSANHIRSLPSKIFERLTLLNELRLSINELKVLSSDIFPVPNAIKIFRMDNNKLEQIETKALQVVKNAEEIDLTDNTCIDEKYEKSNEKAMIELFGMVGLKCTAV